jgi:putative protein-disulfide isomerase
MKLEAEERPTLHYFQDALCGWCYGFAPVVQQLHDTWADSLDVVVYAGGMIKGDGVRALSEMADFIRSARVRVEETTGIVFGEPFMTGLLERGDVMLDSAVPAYGLEAVRALLPQRTLEFSHRLQLALYRDGLDLTSPATYHALAREFGIEPDTFVELIESDEIREAVHNEFDYVASLGIEGFPTLLLEHGDNVHLLAHGYAPFDHLDTMIRVALRG